VRPRVHLEMLRPPTFDAMQERLNEKPGYYTSSTSMGMARLAMPEQAMLRHPRKARARHLAFENEDGTERLVSARNWRTLKTCKVPLFVLNACQSAEEGAATRFIGGIATHRHRREGTVAMSYSVYATSAPASQDASMSNWLR